MPAITVPDILVLPRVPEPDPAAVAERPVLSVTTAPSGFEVTVRPASRNASQIAPRRTGSSSTTNTRAASFVTDRSCAVFL